MKKLIFGYLTVALITGIYSNTFGNYSYASLAYNMGRAIFWPAYLLRSDPEIDGSSTSNFQSSFKELIDAHDRYEGKFIAVSSAGNIILLQYIKENKGISQQEIKDIISMEPSNQNFTAIDNIIKKLYIKHSRYDPTQVYSFLQKKLDGYDYSDLISEGEDAIEEILDIAKNRPKLTKVEPIKVIPTKVATIPKSGEECVDYHIDSLRAEMGSEAIIRYDQIQEFGEICGLPKEEW